MSVRCERGHSLDDALLARDGLYTTRRCRACERLAPKRPSVRVRVTAAGDTPEDAIAAARAYLGRRGLAGEPLRVRRRHVKTGMLGYRAWDIEFVAVAR